MFKTKLTRLQPEVENALPEEVQQIRKYYFTKEEIIMENKDGDSTPSQEQ